MTGLATAGLVPANPDVAGPHDRTARHHDSLVERHGRDRGGHALDGRDAVSCASLQDFAVGGAGHLL